jgi:23S rRNA pseudoU1915 N3-methylase RlmH
MERRDNYEKALREEEDALRASMSRNRAAVEASGDGDPTSGETLAKEVKATKQTPIAPRWARAKREADKKKKSR